MAERNGNFEENTRCLLGSLIAWLQSQEQQYWQQG